MSAVAIRTPGRAGGWLFGPVTDLALGCGLLYAAFFVAEVVAGPEMRRWLPLTLLPFLTLALGSPHYGATLLRVYATRADRRRYFFFAVWVSLLVLVAFIVGLRVAFVGSLILTLYLSWSPWHYSAQNYGVAVLFLRRRGVDLEPATRRLLHASFVLSYVLFLLSMHGEGGTAPQTAIASYEGSIYTLLLLGIPTGVCNSLMLLTLAGYLGCTGAAIGRLWRSGTLQAAAPTLVIVSVQAVWFLLPASVVLWSGLEGVEPFAPQYRAYAFMWVAVGHFLQYLWITTYYAAAEARPKERVAYLGRALLAGAAIWTVPVLVFAPDVLGNLPYDMGLGLLTASAVNIHHFILDGVIWRLRDNRIARMLLGPLAQREVPGAGSKRPGRARSWAGATGWTLAGLVLFVSFAATWESFVGNRASDRGDPERFELSAERRAWLGRDSADIRFLFGVRAMQAGDLERAHRELARGMQLHPTADLWRLEGELADTAGEQDHALAAYDEAIALDPESAPAYYQSGRLLAKRGRLAEARQRLTRANALWPNNPPILQMLGELRDRSLSRASR